MPGKMNFITLEGLQAFKEESESKSNGAYASKMTVEQNATTGVVTFKLYAEDNTLLDTKTLDLDTEHIIKSVSLDYTNKLLVFTMNDDTTLNCDISDLIDNLSSDIQTAIDNEATTRANEITRVEGLITTEENRAKGVENSKVDKVANATENNIALFDSNGNVKDSGKSINDVGKVATVSVGGGTPIQPDQDKNIDLPAYPTRLSLQINNVDNTSDSAKPVSTAQQTAIDSTGHKIDLEIDNTTFKIKAKLYDKNNTLISTSNEIDLPLESVVVGGSYNALTKKVELTLQNGTTIEFSVADLVYGLQSAITAQNPLSSDLVSDDNNDHKFVSENDKTNWNNKYNKPSGGIPKTDLSDDVKASLGKADNAVQQETGKGLSTNDFTNEDKAKLDELDIADTDITDTALYKISGVADTLALPKKSQVEIVKIEGNSRKCSNLWSLNSSYNVAQGSNNSYDELQLQARNGNSFVSLIGRFTWNTTSSLTFSVTSSFNRISIVRNGDVIFNTIVSFDNIVVGNTYTITLSNNRVNMNDSFTISDIMLNEGSTALPYEDYFEGIKDADTTELESCGINIWDEEWELGWINGLGELISSNKNIRSKDFIQVKPNTTYYVYSVTTQLAPRYYDNNKSFISYSANVQNGTLTTPNNCYYMKFTTPDGVTTYNNDICINVSNASINGNYYPYTHDSVNVGSDVLRSVENVRDSKVASGEITRKVGTYTFTGSESWVFRNTTNDVSYYRVDLTLPDGNGLSNLLGAIIFSNGIQKGDGYGGSANLANLDHRVLYLSLPSGTTPSIVFASGTTMYYELATPTTEQGTSFSSNALAVEMYGAEWQNGTTPLQVTKNYDISIKDQVLTNVEVDKKQSEQIKELQKTSLIESEKSFVEDEWLKGLNLLNLPTITGLLTQDISVNLNGTYTFSISGSYTITSGYEGAWIVRVKDSNNNYYYIYPFNINNYKTSVTITGNIVEIYLRAGDSGTSFFVSGGANVMIVEADHPYPYQEWNGKIVHEKQLQEAIASAITTALNTAV